MPTIFVVPAYQAEGPLIKTTIKYYAQSLLQKNPKEELFIVLALPDTSVINQIRGIGLSEKDCEFVFCAWSPVYHFASADGPFSSLNSNDEYFQGSQQTLDDKKISALHIDYTSSSWGITLQKCSIENGMKQSNVDWYNPQETLYIPNNDLLKLSYGITPIADNSDLGLFVKQLKKGLSIIRFKPVSEHSENKSSFFSKDLKKKEKSQDWDFNHPSLKVMLFAACSGIGMLYLIYVTIYAVCESIYNSCCGNKAEEPRSYSRGC